MTTTDTHTHTQTADLFACVEDGLPNLDLAAVTRHQVVDHLRLDDRRTCETSGDNQRVLHARLLGAVHDQVGSTLDAEEAARQVRVAGLAVDNGYARRQATRPSGSYVYATRWV